MRNEVWNVVSLTQDKDDEHVCLTSQRFKQVSEVLSGLGIKAYKRVVEDDNAWIRSKCLCHLELT